MLDLVIFDMDGLMFDTEKLVMIAWQEAGKQLGINISDEVILQTIGLDEEKTKELLIKNVSVSRKVDMALLHELRDEYVNNFLKNDNLPVKTRII